MKLRFERDFKESLFGDGDAYFATGRRSFYKVNEKLNGSWKLQVIQIDEAFNAVPFPDVYVEKSKGKAMDLAQDIENRGKNDE